MGVLCFSTLVSQNVVTTTTTMTTAKTTITATATAKTTTIFSELLGDRLLEHTSNDGGQASNYVATSGLNGKTVALFFA
jgi:hypothetical protein